MDKLIEMLDYYVSACGNSHTKEMRRTFFDQATGAAQMFCFMDSTNESQVMALWNDTYRPKFENLVYGI
jgi:hypothetical protein